MKLGSIKEQFEGSPVSNSGASSYIPPQNQSIPQEEKPPRKKTPTKDFNIKFKEEYGGMEARIKIKYKEDGIVHNYGFYNKKGLPEDINFNTEGMTDEGKKVYNEFKEYVNNVKNRREEIQNQAEQDSLSYLQTNKAGGRINFPTEQSDQRLS